MSNERWIPALGDGWIEEWSIRVDVERAVPHFNWIYVGDYRFWLKGKKLLDGFGRKMV